jgi:hypothetical protein
VLEAAVRWKWIEENPAWLVKNTAPRGVIDPFESWEEIEAIAAELDTTHGVLVEFLVGCSVRPEEAFGAEWPDAELVAREVDVCPYEAEVLREAKAGEEPDADGQSVARRAGGEKLAHLLT